MMISTAPSSRAVIAFAGLDHVQVAAPKGGEAAARRFYGELLGLPELPKPPELAARGGCWFACGDGQLHVGIEVDFRPAKKAHPGLLLADAAAHAALRARLAAADVAIIEGRRGDEGVASFFVEDPFGNRLELVAVVTS